MRAKRKPAWWRRVGVVAVTVASFMVGGCAGPGRELKAPCAPLAYANNASCGPLKPVNAPPFDRVVEAG